MNKKTLNKYNQLVNTMPVAKAIDRFKLTLQICEVPNVGSLDDPIMELVSAVMGRSFTEGYQAGYAQCDFDLKVDSKL